MKTIYLNLKRFDVTKELGGVNAIGTKENYAKTIVEGLEKLNGFNYVVYFQEANILPALEVNNKVRIGCQSVHFEDVEAGKNFGAFTTFRTAKSMSEIGVKDTLIGHCEERKYLNYLFSLGGGKGDINSLLNEEVKRAVEVNMDVLYCVGEKMEEQNNKYEVIRHQLLEGLKGVDLKKITVAYEPVWAIGPGKTPPDKEYIEDIAKFIKSVVDVKVVYGGGLKEENAQMIASIDELDGGLVALTKFGKDFGFTVKDFATIVETYKGGLKDEN